jgi:2',3'-cyclic-nucleotide 2'-phosphodiesterase (5'-nucleotidase family)
MRYLVGILILFLASCGSKNYYTKQVACQSSKVDNSKFASDSQVVRFLAPYKNELDAKMNIKIAELQEDFTKKQPECLLGNWMADAIKWHLDSVEKIKVDFASLNFGGIRIPKLPKGDISLRMIYELMPFDNTVAIVSLDSAGMQTTFEKLVGHRGWPISRGATVSFTKSKNNLEWHVQKTHTDSFYIAVSDYVATGGDRMDFFIKYPKKLLSVKIRDILIAYAKHQKILSAKIEGRVVIEKDEEK